MSRRYDNWLRAYLEYSSFSEAPKHMRFWCAVSAVAGALRRQVWIDQGYFKWYANFYIVLVAPPGVVAKSTTSGVAMQLLRRVPSIRFGPDICTWQSLVTAFAEAKEAFEYPPNSHIYKTMSPLTLESAEFGNLFDPSDRQMVDLFVSLWDGKQGSMEKSTKTSGNDSVENPWINMIACTTPAWIAGSFPEYMIGGGFTSRTIFVWASKKEKRVAYPILEVPKNLGQLEDALVEDLTQISNLRGEMRLTPGAYAWGTKWYDDHLDNPNKQLNDDRFGGYIARKQTHMHKLAMILSAAESDSLLITEHHLSMANAMITELETDMQEVFARIGRSHESMEAERLLAYIRRQGRVSAEEAQVFGQKHFPSNRVYTDILTSFIRSGQIQMVQDGPKIWLVAVPPKSL